MAGIEPQHNMTCHGALIKLNANEYEKIWLSEGGGNGYEEVVVDAIPYNSLIPVKAVALKVKDNFKLPNDINPSRRYLDILIQGAEELKLNQSYIDKLKSIQTPTPSKLSAIVARSHFVLLSFE